MVTTFEQGGAGDDTLIGNAGNDTLTSGGGSDRLLYDTNAAFTTSAVGLQLVTDFTIGTDKFVLDKTTFTSDLAPFLLSPTAHLELKFYNE